MKPQSSRFILGVDIGSPNGDYSVKTIWKDGKTVKSMKNGIELIAEERQRQIDVEGYTKQHDSHHQASEFLSAVLAYVEAARAGVSYQESGNINEAEIYMAKRDKRIFFPWGEANFKPTTDVRDLVKAGALIAAAIDRLQNQ